MYVFLPFFLLSFLLQQLQLHFDREHFVCHEPECLMARFVVFENEIDLRGHEISVHGQSLAPGGSTKIRLEFRVRRDGDSSFSHANQRVPDDDEFNFGLDGSEAFVPESISGEEEDGENQIRSGNIEHQQENEQAITHVAHAERTAQFRTEAARLRATRQLNDGNDEDDFPSLENSVSTGLSTTLWTSEKSAVVTRNNADPTAITEGNFPSLGVNTSVLARGRSGRGGINAVAKGNATATAQFSAMRLAASSTNNMNSTKETSYVYPSANSTNRAIINNNMQVPKLGSDDFPSLDAGMKKVDARSRVGRKVLNGGSSTAAAQFAAIRLESSKINHHSNTNLPSSSSFCSEEGTSKLMATPIKPPKISSENFPSLGGGWGKKCTTAASTGRNIGYHNVSTSSVGALTGSFRPAINQHQVKNTKKSSTSNTTKPSMKTRLEDFPSIDMKSSRIIKQKSQGMLDEKIAAARKNLPPSIQKSHHAHPTTVGRANTENGNSLPDLESKIMFPPTTLANTSDGKAQVSAIKEILGKPKFKNLKSLTRDFANGIVEPSAYINEAASLFEGGFKNRVFCSFMPGFISWCPNETASSEALVYLEKRKESNNINGSIDVSGSNSRKKQNIPISRSGANAPCATYSQGALSSTYQGQRNLKMSAPKKTNVWG